MTTRSVPLDDHPTAGIARRRRAIPARIFVGNLDFRVTTDSLTRLLSEAGQVVDVYLPSDRATGRPRGFAFVQFATEAEAASAIRLFHDREVDGRKLTVNEAADRPAHAGGPRPDRSAGPPPSFDGPAGRDRPPGGAPFKRKGSRRGLRGRKRSL